MTACQHCGTATTARDCPTCGHPTGWLDADPWGAPPPAGGPPGPPPLPAAPRKPRRTIPWRTALGVIVLVVFGWIIVRGWFPNLFAAPSTPAVNDLVVGDCYIDDTGEPSHADCSAHHDGEVFGVGTWNGGDAYPGQDVVARWASDLCAGRFEPYIGTSLDDTALSPGVLYPSADTWDTGDRRAVCVVSDPAGRSSGSLAGSGR